MHPHENRRRGWWSGHGGDVLGLGMLGCLRRAFELLEDHKGERLDMASIPPEDPATYAMIRKADTLGTFQIESRAQMAMLPRLKPREFYDLVIQVAIVRPGPIQMGWTAPMAPACPHASRWDCTLEPGSGRWLAVRLGLRMVQGLSNADAARLIAHRGGAPYGSVEEVWRRAGLLRAALERLAEADAFRGLGLDRRQALWAVRALAHE
jgi:error-prone DNA polymerase